MKTIDVINLLKENCPIAICDGMQLQRDSFFELYAGSWLRRNELEFKLEDSLYYRSDYDLSKYKTIFFESSGMMIGGDEKFAKILGSFSKENLKVIVVGSEYAYRKIESLAKKLKIKVIFFEKMPAEMWVFQAREEAEKKQSEYPLIDNCWSNIIGDLFLDPDKVFKKRK